MEKTITVMNAQYEREYMERECYRKAADMLREQMNFIFQPLTDALKQARAEEAEKERREEK